VFLFSIGWRVAEFHDEYAGNSWTLNNGLEQNGGWNFYYSYGDM
jgi:hypothetical protein